MEQENKSPAISISNIEIIPFRPKQGHVGFVSFVINDQFFVGDVAMFTRPGGGIRLAYAVKKLQNGTTVDIFKPITKEVDQCIESVVTEKYELILRGDGTAREDRNEIGSVSQ